MDQYNLSVREMRVQFFQKEKNVPVSFSGGLEIYDSPKRLVCCYF